MTDDKLRSIHASLLQLLAEADPQVFDVDKFEEMFDLCSPWYQELKDWLMKADPPIGSVADMLVRFSGDPSGKVRFSLGSHISRSQAKVPPTDQTPI